jgi:hypothetical protein
MNGVYSCIDTLLIVNEVNWVNKVTNPLQAPSSASVSP